MAARPIFSDIDSSYRKPSPRYVEDPSRSKKYKKSTKKIPLRASEWVEHFVKIKDGDRGQVIPIDFSSRRYLRRIYDTRSPKILLMTSRQTEKSTTLGNKLLAMAGMHPNRAALFVTPSAMQTKVFSSARLDDIIEISPMVRGLTHPSLTMNLLEKEFLQGVRIYLRYAFLSADRIRGLSVNEVYADEIQDLVHDLMPVIEETASHHKGSKLVYSGTPKTFDNTIENYWAKHSTQSEWVIPCEHHGTPKDPSSWYWVVLGPKNIGKAGPICDRCGKTLNPEHPHANWASMNPGADFEGYRLCRLMVPWMMNDPAQWDKWVLQPQRSYSTAKFMNEVLALSYDSGTKPLTRMDIINACDPAYDMDEAAVRQLAESHVLFGGIDWGTGEQAYTVLSVGGYVRSDASFQIVYSKRFDGPLIEPEAQMAEIFRLINLFRLKLVGTDYGMGFHPNKRLVSVYSAARIHSFQYVSRQSKKIVYNNALNRYTVFRTPIMSDGFNAIKAMKVRLPSYEVYKEPFASDMLSIHSEYSNTLKMIQYAKPRSLTDDTYHSILYALLASFLMFPRRDIIAPLQEAGSEEAAARMAEQQAIMDIESQLPPD